MCCCSSAGASQRRVRKRRLGIYDLILYISLLVFLFPILLSAQTSLADIGLTSGRYTVGFKHYLAHDKTRTYKRTYDWNNTSLLGRPVPISVWYPCDSVEANTRLTVLEYMEILKEEEEWEHLPNEQILNWFYYRPSEANIAHLQEVTTAHENVTPVGGAFPAIIYAPGFQKSSIENFALCEYLASHGYIVVASPSRGTETLLLEGGTTKDLETQARDIEFLLGELTRFEKVDLHRIATMGYSFGGLSNVLAQMKNDRIAATVCLDGSVKYVYDTLKQSPFFDIQASDVPFLHMSQKDIPEDVLREDNIDPKLNTDFQFYDDLTNSHALRVKFNHLTHSYFTSLGVLFEERDPRQDRSDGEIMESYHLMARLTLDFLESFLKDGKDDEIFWDKSIVEAESRGLVTIDVKRPKTPEFSFEDFNVMAAEQDYESLNELHQIALKDHPNLLLPQFKLNTLGLQLLYTPSTSQQGVRVLNFAVAVHPQSSNLYDSLGEAHLYIGDVSQAKLAFERSLELNAQNTNAIKRLRELK